MDFHNKENRVLNALRSKSLLSSSLVLKSSVAFLDQAVLSGTSFLISLFLMKNVPKEEYGYYSIVFAISLFLVSIQSAVVTTPLAVSLAAKKDEHKQHYVAALYWGQFAVVIPTVCLGLSITGALYLSGLNVLKVLTIGSFCLAAIGILLREFSRAYYFAKESPFVVLKLDSCYALTYLGLITIAYLFFHITVPGIFVFMGISGFLTSRIFNRNWKFDWAGIRESYRENWSFGRWSLMGVFVTHVQSYCNLYLTGALLSSSAVGSVSASRLPLAPLSLIQTGWGKVVIPRGARLRENQQLQRFLREQILVCTIVGIAIVLYVVFLLMSCDFLKTFLFNRGYENSLDFVIFWGAINMVSFFGLTASSGLQVMREFRVIAKVNFVTMIITLGSNYIFIRCYGIKGGLASSLLGEILLAIALWGLLIQRYFLETRPAFGRGRRGLLGWTYPDPKKGIPL